MNKKQTALARKQLERRLAPLRVASLTPPPRGWIKALRESLGMTARQLAARMGAAPSRVPVIEKAEVSGATTIKTMRQVAEAMDCTFVYAFVPARPLEDVLRRRAEEKVRADIARLDHSMRLENQALRKADLEAERQRMIDLALSGSLRGLWDEQR
jgi:predicted DNA-binding mobile mystery protein A